MNLADFFSTPQFLATLLGAATAFGLGMFATWRNNNSSKRDAGNIALVVMSQMYSIAENLRYHMLVVEPAIAAKNTGLAEPYTFQLRLMTGLPDQPPSIDLKSLGFLVDSHDPDVLNRLLGVERQFRATLDLVNRHSRLHDTLQEKLNALDPTGRTPMHVSHVVDKIGVRSFIEIDDVVSDLRQHLGETSQFIQDVGSQLRRALTMQFPLRKFVYFTPMPRSRIVSQAPDVHPRMWRRAVRILRDSLVQRIPPEKKLVPAAALDEPLINVKRTIKRSFEEESSRVRD